MKFVIRDDDLNYFSNESIIENYYRDVFELNIPVGFSVIPFISYVEGLTPPEETLEKCNYSIGENKNLVSYINNNSLIDIMQHGYSHKEGNSFEYCQNKNLYQITEKGKKELERVFLREINVFVPPHDRISNHGIKVIEKLGMNIIRGKGTKNFILRKEYISTYSTMFRHRLRHIFLSREKMPPYPYILDLGLHKEAFSFRLNEDNMEYLEKALLYIHNKNGNFIITNHLHNFNEIKKNNLLNLIKLAKKLNAEFVKPSQLFK